jgi:CubicO group peptidase (beta-lactamase class C family)
VTTLAAALADGVARGLAPGAVAGMVAAGGAPQVVAAGLRAADAPEPMAPDAMFRLHSLTKAVGAVCAAMLAEAGSLDLEAPVARYLPEFAAVPVLAGWDGDRPILRAPARPATVAELATHTSGSVYAMWSDDLRRYQAVTGARPAARGGRAGLRAQPLAFDPGAAWGYGEGIDWLGLVVEAVTGEPIDAFCARRLFRPLGMVDTVFELDPARAARLAAPHVATPDGFEARPAPPGAKVDFHGMGHALIGTAGDYLRFLSMVLNGGALDGARVLRPDTVRDLLLTDRIAPLSVAPMRSAIPAVTCDVDLFPGVPLGHSLMGAILRADVPGRRSAGGVGWAGVMNCWWWLDPARGVAGVLLMQVSPFAHPRALALLDACERAVAASAPSRAAD